MHIVDEWYVGPSYATSVWLSREARKDRDKLQKRHTTEIPKLAGKVKYWAGGGFAKFEGGEGFPIKHESDGPGTYRIGHSSLFRFLGFYENDDKTKFIIIDFYLKKDKGLNDSDRDRIRAVANVKNQSLWRRATPDDGEPK